LCELAIREPGLSSFLADVCTGAVPGTMQTADTM